MYVYMKSIRNKKGSVGIAEDKVETGTRRKLGLAVMSIFRVEILQMTKTKLSPVLKGDAWWVHGGRILKKT